MGNFLTKRDQIGSISSPKLNLCIGLEIEMPLNCYFAGNLRTVQGHGGVLGDSRATISLTDPRMCSKILMWLYDSLNPLHSATLSGILAGVIGFLQAPLSTVLDCLYLLSHNGSKVFLNS